MVRIEEVIEQNPILMNNNFLKRFPNIITIAAYIEASKIASEKPSIISVPLMEVGVKSTGEYLEALNSGNEKALNFYQRVYKTQPLTSNNFFKGNS
ncbi:hypothetical protein HYT23_05375 [Candidatus Pacearchaeota archaeon]|nr:hypothetical protein [Candidatus Pacearchaeota archaeon]